MTSLLKSGNWIYVLLLIVQSGAALTILVYIQKTFRILIDRIGVANAVSARDFASLALAILVCQICFWIRVTRVPLPDWRSLVLGHILTFAGRISFIFGGALFAMFFLRHTPELVLDDYLFGVAWRGAIVMTTLFALYCYALELERLGGALQTNAAVHPDGAQESHGQTK